MKLLIDQQLPAALMGWFHKQGVEAMHVRHLGMAAASDSEIWAYALREGHWRRTSWLPANASLKSESFPNRLIQH